MPEGVRVQYQEELENLEGSALGGLDMVNTALGRTMEAVEHQDVELAQVVINDDDRIDGRYLEVHQSLITLLATQSPVATDLRLISSLLHVLKSIERMGARRGWATLSRPLRSGRQRTHSRPRNLHGGHRSPGHAVGSRSHAGIAVGSA